MDEEQEVKKRRVKDADFDKVEAFIKSELESREKNPARRSAEKKWKEVDRQIAMEPMKRVSPDGREIKGDWGSAIELGELAKASEIIAADVMRIAFSNDNWFEPHVDLEGFTDPSTGRMVVQEPDQERADGLLRALMVQQHKDFGFKDRVELAVKEALHHGSLVCEVRWDQQMMVDGAKVKTVGAPVLVPYSMWNAFPDPSPSVVGTTLFYPGSMILREYMPLHKLKRMKGDGWIQPRLKKVKKGEHKDKDNETHDVCLVKFYGDVVIERQDGDIYLPNMKAITANNTLVYLKESDLPFPSVIFSGYERQDVRDPYYTSPIIKQSPTQKFTTVMANEAIDCVRLKTRPPVEYDGNDPDYVANGGPVIAPGAKTSTKSMGKGMKTLEIGDPTHALHAMEFGFRQLQEGLGVSSLRQGSQSSDRQTATEARLMEQGSEVRTIDFIGKVERMVLKPFLYMQHALNRKYMGEYEAYSNEMNTPDVVRFTRKDIDVQAHFDVVGARGILGERERQQQVANTVVFLSGNPLFAPLLKPERIAMEMFKDAGKKNPEEWVRTQQDGMQIPPQVQAQMQQMGQVIQALQAELQKAQSGLQAKIAEIAADRQATAEEQKLAREKAAADYALRVKEIQQENALRWAEFRAETAIELAKARSNAQANSAGAFVDMHKAAGEFAAQLEQMSLGHATEIAKAAEKIVKASTSISDAAEKAATKPKRKARIRRTPEGYELEEDGGPKAKIKRTADGFEVEA